MTCFEPEWPAIWTRSRLGTTLLVQVRERSEPLDRDCLPGRNLEGGR
jgi:hypothetical protein